MISLRTIVTEILYSLCIIPTFLYACTLVIAGKVVLEGSMAQKLNQLDKRETELLEETEKQRGLIKKLKEDRIFYRKKNEEKEYVVNMFILFSLITSRMCVYNSSGKNYTHLILNRIFSKEIRKLKLDVEELQAELDDFYNKDKSRAPRPASRRSSMKSSPARSRTG